MAIGDPLNSQSLSLPRRSRVGGSMYVKIPTLQSHIILIPLVSMPHPEAFQAPIKSRLIRNKESYLISTNVSIFERGLL